MSLGTSTPWAESAISFGPGLGSSTTYYSYIWYATSASSGADTVTANFATAVTGSVSIYELNGISSTGLSSSTGSSSAGSTAVSVASFTPSSSAVVIGNVESASSSETFTVGSGFTLSGTCTPVYGCGEYQAGV